MESVKLPRFSGEEADFDVWKLRFKAFAATQSWGPALLDSSEATAKQHGDLYANLVLALPEDDLAIIEDIDQDSSEGGHLAWTALVRHYEDDGIYRCAQLLEQMDQEQQDDETSLEYLNRLVRLQKKLARVDEIVTDRRVIMHLVKGLKDDYASITDTWDVATVTLDMARKDLLQKGKRVENRKGSKNGQTSAFAAQFEQVLVLEKQLRDVQAQLARLQDGGGKGQNASGGSRQPFKGRCYHCGDVGHRRNDCPARKKGKEAAGNAATPAGAIAFPATVASPTLGLVAANTEATAYAVNVGGEEHTPFQHYWLSDTGATAHMTAVKDDYDDYKDLPEKIWVKGICAYAVGTGTVQLSGLRTTDGRQISIRLNDVLHVPELSARASGSYHRLFSLTKARSKGHRLVLEEPVDYLEIQSSGSIFKLPLIRALGLIWLPAPDGGCADTAVVASAAVVESKRLWHARLGHLGESGMSELLKTGVSGLGYTAREVLGFCDSCAICKSQVRSIPRSPAEYPDIEVFEVLGIDFEGPMGTKSLGGCLYGFAAVCFKSRFILYDSLQSKDDAPQSFLKMLAVVKAFRHIVRRVRIDNDSVLLGSSFQAVLVEHQISLELTAPYSGWQHGRIERQWGTIVPMAESMMHAAGLARSYWALAVSAVVHIRNRVWSSGAGDIPYRVVTGQQPDLSHLRVFGCPAFVHIDKSRRRKLSARAWKGVFVGYAPDSPVWLVYNPTTRRVVRSRNVVFDEHAVIPVSMGEMKAPVVVGDAVEDEDSDGGYPCGEGDADSGEPVEGKDSDETDDDAGVEGQETLGQDMGEPVGVGVRRSSRVSKMPSEWWKVARPGGAIANLSVASQDSHYEPASYKQALRSPQSEEWQAAITSEYESLVSRKTWKLVPRPAGRKLVDSKWVFKVKRNSDGSIARYKARLVARGFTQEHGVDYNETFAPTVRVMSLRVLMALVAFHDWEAEQLDVVTAFLEADIDEEIYMRQPEGYRQTDEHGVELVCQLQKSIYGLKQAPRNWNKTITTWLLQYGFTQSHVDPCVYTYTDGSSSYILALYVDDSILVGPPGPFIRQFKEAFGQRFNVQFLGPVSWMLGISVHRDREARTIKLGQKQYILDVLERFNMGDCNAVTSPMVVGSVTNSDEDHQAPLESSVPYQSLIGSLLYAAVCTRPDITMVVSHLSRYMAKPMQSHWEQAKRVLRYLKGTADHGILYGVVQSTTLFGYSDADHASDGDGRRSRTGYVFMLNGGAVSWRSQKQQSVALSTAEAEYMALAATTQEAMFLRQLMMDMQQHQHAGTVIYEDNQSCIALTKNTMTTGRSKHIDIKYHFCRERQESGDIDVQYCSTEDMLADVLTKPVAAPRHKKLCALMMGIGCE